MYQSFLKVKVNLTYDPYVGEVPVRREGICTGPSVLWSRVVSSFPRRLYFPNVSIRCPFAAGWTVNELATLSSKYVSKCFGVVGKRTNRYSSLLAHIVFLGFVDITVEYLIEGFLWTKVPLIHYDIYCIVQFSKATLNYIIIIPPQLRGWNGIIKTLFNYHLIKLKAPKRPVLLNLILPIDPFP